MKKEFKKKTLDNKNNKSVISQLYIYLDDLNNFTFDAIAYDYQGEYIEEIIDIIKYLKVCVYNLKECILKEPYRKDTSVDIMYLKMLEEYTYDLKEFDLYINSSLNRTIKELIDAINGFINLYISFFDEYHKFDIENSNKSKLKEFIYKDDSKIKKDEYVKILKKRNKEYYNI